MINSNEGIILTIGIPVYNGEKFVSELLDSIQIPLNLRDKVEILVSDNCSSDNTVDVVKSYRNVTLLQSDLNYGYDENAYKLFKYAKGKFVWTIGSDDILIGVNSISNIVSILSENIDAGLVFVGGCSSLENEYSIYCNDECFFFDSEFRSGFASYNIVNRAFWLESNPQEYFGTGWVHFGVILKIVINSKCIITRSTFVQENPNFFHLNKSWNINGKGLIIMLELVKIFDESRKYGYSRLFELKSKYIIKAHYPKEIIKAKASGLIINIILVKKFIKYYHDYFNFWIIDLPVLLIPNYLARFIYSLRKVIK